MKVPPKTLQFSRVRFLSVPYGSDGW